MDKTPGIKKNLLNAKEAATYLNISLSTLRRMENRGILIALRTPGGHRRYTMQMLDESLKPYPHKAILESDNQNE